MTISKELLKIIDILSTAEKLHSNGRMCAPIFFKLPKKRDLCQFFSSQPAKSNAL
jgi:hypothetical protein